MKVSRELDDTKEGNIEDKSIFSSLSNDTNDIFHQASLLFKTLVGYPRQERGKTN
jgi:hypothetical protein